MTQTGTHTANAYGVNNVYGIADDPEPPETGWLIYAKEGSANSVEIWMIQPDGTTTQLGGGGGGAAVPLGEVAVGTGSGVTGFADFTWDDTSLILHAGESTTAAGTLTNATVLASKNSTINGSVNAVQEVAIIGSLDAQILGAGIAGIFASSNSIIGVGGTNQSLIGAIVGAWNSELIGGVFSSGIFSGTGNNIDDGATDSAILGGSGGYVGSSCISCIVIGGVSTTPAGVVASSVTNGVSINGGQVATSNTTAIGGAIIMADLPTAGAGGSRVVCFSTTTGRLFVSTTGIDCSG